MDRVLLVEDEMDVRENIIDLLAAKGYSVTAASNGSEALAYINSKMPDIIISDIMMPEMNGYEFFNNVRQHPSGASVPFLFLTAKVNNADVRLGMNMGADDYLTKPFKATDLLKAIELRLNKQKSSREKIEGISSNIAMYVPHELRTPLVSIIGFSDLLLHENSHLTRDEIADMADKINKAGKRLTKTIDKFISYVESDLMLQKKESYKINEKFFSNSAAKTIYAAVNSAGSERLHDFVIDISDPALMISEEHFNFIAAELIENAVKFSPAGSPVSIQAREDGDYFLFEVTDYGRGMSNYEISNIAPFFQYKRELLQQDGNGLGLITVKKFLEFYNGTLNIRSEENIYTSVTCKIPLKKKIENTHSENKIEVNNEMV